MEARGTRKKRIKGLDSSASSNEIAASVDLSDQPISDQPLDPDSEKEERKRDEELKVELKEKVAKDAGENKKSTDGGEVVSDEELEEYATGSSSKDMRIFRVEHIEDNLLWSHTLMMSMGATALGLTIDTVFQG